MSVGAKPDILSFLLGMQGGWQTVRDISQATGYTAAAIRRACDDMSLAGMIVARPGIPAAYHAEAIGWSQLLGLGRRVPPWRWWNERFAFVAAFLSWSDSAEWAHLTRYAAGVKVWELVESHRIAFQNVPAMKSAGQTRVEDRLENGMHAISALGRWMHAHV